MSRWSRKMGVSEAIVGVFWLSGTSFHAPMSRCFADVG
jgi:hypothetical protein